MRLEIDLDLLAAEVATRVAEQFAERIASQAPSRWMAMDEAVAYTRIRAGTFRKWVAAGRIPAHGGRRQLLTLVSAGGAAEPEPPHPQPS